MNNKVAFIAILMLHSLFGVAQGIENSFKTIVDTTYENNKDAIGILIHVESPDENLSWTYAVGTANKKSGAKLDEGQAVLIASNTKTYVTASILRLVETNQLQLDEPIEKLLKRKTRKALKKNGYNASKITVRHLLSHTSGITDYVNEDYWNFIDKNPRFRWTRNKQIKRAMEVAEPVKAGTSFAYGDINYLLLTEIMEKKTKQKFFVAMRELLAFDANQINHTWFETLDKRPVGIQLAHQYSNKQQWDSYNLDPSWDLFGGGGLAATTNDVARFYQLLFNGQIVKDKNVLAEMTKYVLPKEASRNYALGIYNVPSFFETNVYYHGGWWGTDALYIPEINTSIAVFTLQKESRNSSISIAKEIIEILKSKER